MAPLNRDGLLPQVFVHPVDDELLQRLQILEDVISEGPPMTVSEIASEVGPTFGQFSHQLVLGLPEGMIKQLLTELLQMSDTSWCNNLWLFLDLVLLLINISTDVGVFTGDRGDVAPPLFNPLENLLLAFLDSLFTALTKVSLLVIMMALKESIQRTLLPLSDSGIFLGEPRSQLLVCRRISSIQRLFEAFFA